MTATASPSTRTTWKLDPSHSTIEFVAKHMMITTVKGRFAEFDGTIVADEQNIADSQVDVTMKAASLDTRSEQRDQHLRSPDFLHVEEHPSITFKSTRIELPAGAHVRSGFSFKIVGDQPVFVDEMKLAS